MVRYISLLLFIGLAFGQSKMNINNLSDYGGKMFKENDDKPYTGRVFDLYRNSGEKKLEGNYRNGNKNGKWTWWNEEGGTDSTGSYKNGLMNGIWQFYDSNGNLKAKVSLKNGEKHGKLTEWYNNGHKKIEIHYKDGKPDGQLLGYNTDGISNGYKEVKSVFLLSPVSQSIVSRLNNQITIKVYFSDNLPGELFTTSAYLNFLLEKYKYYSDNVRFYFHNPESDKDLEEQAQKDGIQPVQMQVIENDKEEIKKVYLGLVMLYEDKKEIIPVIQTTAGLEYLISTKIKSLIDIDKKTIGLVHLNSETEMETDNLSTQLSQHYNFRNVDLSTSDAGDVDVLLVTGATDTLDSTVRNNLDLFLSSGKSVFISQSGVDADIQSQQVDVIQSDIFDFLDGYNLNLQKNLVLDKKCGSVSVRERRGIFMMNRAMEYPFFPIVDSFNKDEVVVSEIEQAMLFFPSEIKIDTSENELLAGTVGLFTTSENSGIMEGNWSLSPDSTQNPFIRILGQQGKILAATSKLVNGGELMLVSNSKFLSDQSGMSVPDNLVFIMNAVDYLTGDEELIALRSLVITDEEKFWANVFFDGN